MQEKTFSAKARLNVFQSLKEHPLDAVVIGGGITGAGCLRDAALRGLRVALFEREDFSFGASGRSSKLIHGGIRYLETWNWSLVYEGLRERNNLLKTAPKIVRPFPFLYPVYRGHHRPLWIVSLGVFLYYLLALGRNINAPKILGRKKTQNLEPTLRKDNLRGATLYYDAITDDTALTLATLESGWKYGGTACNYAEVEDLLEHGKDVIGVRVRDLVENKTYEIRSRWVINATGPWSDLLRRQMDENVRPLLRPTKGAHLVIHSKKLCLKRALLLISPVDHRVTFAIPWKGFSLIGTTDTDYKGDPNDVTADEKDVEYLLENLNYYFPNVRLQKKDVVSTFAGLRPLIKDDHDSPSSVSREHKIYSDRQGLVTIAGGKLTSYRQMAEDLVDWIIAHTSEWKDKFKKCQTHVIPLESPEFPLKNSLSEVIPGTGVSWEDIHYAVDHQMAVSVDDILSRRTSLTYLDVDHGLGISSEIAMLLAKKMNLEKNVVSEQLRKYIQTAKQAAGGLE